MRQRELVVPSLQLRKREKHTQEIQAHPGSITLGGGHPGSRLGAPRNPWGGGSPFGPRPLAIAANLGAAPATPALRGSGTWPRPFSNRLARKLCACLVSWAAARAVCGRAGSGGDCGAATGGRCSTWVPSGRPRLSGPPAVGRGAGDSSGLVLHGPLRLLSPDLHPSSPPSGKLYHSGNDDSVRIIQARLPFIPPLPPYFFGDFTIA